MSQNALFLQSKQSAFAVARADIPEPQAGELLIKNEAAGLNPIDWKIQAYGIVIGEFPAILGIDAAGTVHAVGDAVEGWAVGDRVLYGGAYTNTKANFQQFSLVPHKLVAKLPDQISFDQGAALPLAISTAAVGLYHTEGGPRFSPPWKGGRGKYAGSILVIGGSSIVGTLAIQLSALSGFSPIITTASLKNESLLRSYGATHVLDRNLSADELKARVAEIAAHPLVAIYDAVSLPDTQNAAFDILKETGGVLLTVLPDAVDPAKKEAARREGKKEVAIVAVQGSIQTPPNVDFGTGLFASLTSLLEEGAIKPVRVEVLPDGLSGIPAGLERLKNNQVSAAKLVAQPQDTT